MNGLSDLLKSERGVFALAVLLAATLLAALRVIDGATWLDFAKYLTAALIASKTVTTAVEIHATKKPQQPEIPTATVVKGG